jgi:4-amino-4-deoxy-L-arabinose transferase-like glycosyltransferase
MEHMQAPSPDRYATAPLEAPAWGGREALLVPLMMLAAAVLLRGMGFLLAVIDTDEGLYLVQAREWLRGHWPLVAVWDMHPVGAPALFAMALLVFGDGVAAIRWLGIFCAAATGTGLYALVRAAGGGPLLGLAAGLIYIAHSVLLYGLASNTEILFAPFVVWAMVLGLRGGVAALDCAVAPGWLTIIGMGLLIGLGFAIKPVVTPEGCLAFALLTLPALWRRLLQPGRFVGMAAAYAVLALLPSAMLALSYASQGQFGAWLDGSLLAPWRYSQARVGLTVALARCQTAVLILAAPCLLALLALWRQGRSAGSGGRLARLGVIWLLMATLAIVGPGFFYQHYFLLWLPPLALLAALGIAELAGLMGQERMRPVFIGLLALLCLGAWRQEAALRLERALWVADPVREVAKTIRERLRPGEAIFVANYHPVLYALTDAALPTRFIFPEHLTGHFTQVADIDTEAELRRVLASRPRFVVVDRGWWPQVGERGKAILNEVLARDYELEVTIPEERGPVELWRPRT